MDAGFIFSLVALFLVQARNGVVVEEWGWGNRKPWMVQLHPGMVLLCLKDLDVWF